MNSSRNVRALVTLAAMACSVAPAQTMRPQVATGPGDAIALKSNGAVWTWGGSATLPARVPGLSAIREVAAGDGFWLAVRIDGSVWAWGGNEYSHDPRQIPGLNGIVTAVAAGQRAVALQSDGTVWSWGDDPLRKHSIPTQVEGLRGVTAIAASVRHTVALKSDGTVWVWGFHGAGDLGNGEYGLSGSPVQIPGLAGSKAIAAGQDLTVAVKQDGTVWTIGYGAAGQLGNGSSPNSTTVPVRVVGLSDVEAITAGAMHVLALRRDGTVWAWGYNHDGQLGNLTAGERSSKPVRVGSLSGVVSVSAASNHSMALTQDGSLWAWGQNEGDILGAGEEVDRSSVPMRVGESLPPRCTPLFSCQTASNKLIQICGLQDEADVSKWSAIQYRFGPEDGPPELIFPKQPSASRPPLYFSHEESKGDYRVTVRFSNGGYSYRVFSGSESGAGVEVANAGGKHVTTIECAERPEMFVEYLRLSLPCDKQNPHGPAACQEAPYRAK